MAIGVTAQLGDEVRFGPFRLDVVRGCLWRSGEVVSLRPKIWQLLCALAANPGRLLTKDELIGIVWDGNAVGDTLPNVSVTELRRVLGDDAKNPRYIQTVHGRGFRFIAALQSTELPSAAPALGAPSSLLVGRERELDLLQAVIDGDSDCRVGFISGEAGIGKTSLLNALLERAASAGSVVGRGQCVAHFGKGYPHLALLGALEDMCRRHAHVLPLLRTIAPTWLTRLPGLVSIEEYETLQRKSEERAPFAPIDELIALQEAVGGVVWAIEDLHWANHATVEVLSVLIERAPRSSCCVVATYRLAEAIVRAHPLVRLRRELRRRQRCREVLLEGLNGAGVTEYLALRRPGTRFPEWLPGRLLARTGGNPFFLTSTVDHLISAGALDLGNADGSNDWDRLASLTDEIPPTLRDSLREQIGEIDPAERRLLEAASIGGLEIDAATIAAVLDDPVVAVDAECTTLSRHSPILQRIGESVWSDGTTSGRYQFRHVLYPEVLYDEQSPAARREAHGRIARALATGFSGTGQAAPMIADHFERGGDNDAAISHHIVAARLSNERFASKEAAWHLRRALSLLPKDAGASDDRETMILGELARVLPALEGFGDPELCSLYLRALRAPGSASETSSDYAVMAGLVLANLMQRRPAPAEDLARELLEAAVDSTSRAYAEHLMGAVNYHQGNLMGTIEHAERGLALAPGGLTLGPVDYRCSALAMNAAALWQIGRLDESVARAKQALGIARSRVHPFNLIITLQAVIAIHHWRGDREIVLAMARELGNCVQEQGITQAEACAHLLEAWALFDGGDRDSAERAAERGLAALRQYGTMMQSAYLLSVAIEVFVGCKRVDEAVELLRDALALVDDGAARWWEPELHRWQGALVVIERRADGFDEAESFFASSLHVAAQQKAGSLRLRTSIDLGRLWIARGRHEEARRLIDQATAHIVGGADTRDLRLAGTVRIGR